MRKMSVAVVCLVAVAAAVGCGTSSPAGERTGARASAIQGGAVDNGDPFAVGVCVGGSGPGDCPYVCSGALIAPNLVITARHCIQQVPNPDQVNCATDSFSGQPRTARITTYYNMFQSTKGWHSVSKIVTPPAAEVCGNDLALLVLRDNVPAAEATPVTPAVRFPMTDHTLYPTHLETAIGYGNTSPTASDAGTRRILESVRILCIPGDKQLDCGDAGAGVFTDKEFYTDDGTCSGDSGSSAYDQTSYDTNQPVTFGVLSRGGQDNGSCVGGVYTRLDAWRDLVVNTAIAAATQGNYQPASWTLPPPPSGTDAAATASPDGAPAGHELGATCTADAECASKVCAGTTGSDAFVCSQACDPSTADACPDGFACTNSFCFAATPAPATTTTVKSGCALGGPTNPVPWHSLGGGVAVVLGLVFARRRRRRA